MKRFMFLFILLLSASVYAQYCPVPKALSEEKVIDLSLTDDERVIWVTYNQNVDDLKLRAKSPHAETAFTAKKQLAVLERIFQQVENAKEKNKRDLVSKFKDLCMNTKPTGRYRGECIGQVSVKPVREDVTFVPEGVYAAVLRVKASGNGECSFIAHNLVPMRGELPVVPPVTEKGPIIDCNRLPSDILFGRWYRGYNRGGSTVFRVYYKDGYEITCAQVADRWELFKKVIYEAPTVPPPITGDVTSVGLIKVLKRLPENRYSGVIARTDGVSPTRIFFNVKGGNFYQNQRVRFVMNSATGATVSVVPIG